MWISSNIQIYFSFTHMHWLIKLFFVCHITPINNYIDFHWIDIKNLCPLDLKQSISYKKSLSILRMSVLKNI